MAICSFLIWKNMMFINCSYNHQNESQNITFFGLYLSLWYLQEPQPVLKKMCKFDIKSIIVKGKRSVFILVILYQGWEFAHRFPERITRLLQKMSKWAIRSKIRAIRSFAQFWWGTWAIRSWSLIFGERPEWIAHGCSFLVSDLRNWLTSLIKKEERSDSLIF